jgi:hypothetical protein
MPPRRGWAGGWRAGYKDTAPDGAENRPAPLRHQRHPPLLRKRRAVLETVLILWLPKKFGKRQAQFSLL